ncbi:MAG: heme-binding domain-containing protein [Omnitrophica WOR_2 bacterium]
MVRRTITLGALAILALIILFGLVQLVPYGHNHTNPPVVQEPNWDSPQTRELAVRACFDCHSNQTVWLWYSNIAPFSWLIQRDVDEGRRSLNFSEWNRTQRRAREAANTVAEGRMPPIQYLIIHANANLNNTDKNALVQGLLKTLGGRSGLGE